MIPDYALENGCERQPKCRAIFLIIKQILFQGVQKNPECFEFIDICWTQFYLIIVQKNKKFCFFFFFLFLLI